MTDEIHKVTIDSLRLEDCCQAREKLDHEAIEAYADIYREDEVQLPPIEVFDVDGDLVVVDGFHRTAAAMKAGRMFIAVHVVGQGNLEFAAWTALAKNHKHGVRRTNADKRKAVRLALDGGIGCEQSHRALAKHLGVSGPFVAKIRREWEQRFFEPQAAEGLDAEPSTAEPSTLERAEALDHIASRLYRAVGQAHREVERISAGAFPDVAEFAADVFAAARTLKQVTGAVCREESGLRIAC